MAREKIVEPDLTAVVNLNYAEFCSDGTSVVIQQFLREAGRRRLGSRSKREPWTNIILEELSREQQTEATLALVEAYRLIAKKWVAAQRISSVDPIWKQQHHVTRTLNQLLGRKLPWSDAQLTMLFSLLSRVHYRYLIEVSVKRVIAIAESLDSAARSKSMQQAIERFAERLSRTIRRRYVLNSEEQRLPERIASMRKPLTADEPVVVEIKPCDAWTNTLVDSLNPNDEAKHQAWTQLLAHCEGAKSSSPSKTFLKKAQPLVEAIGTTNYIEVTSSVLQSVGTAFGEPPDSNDPWVVDNTTLIDDRYANLLRGLVWTTSLVDDEALLASLAGAADLCFQKVKNVGPRAPKIGNACLWVFAHSESLEAVAQLNRLLGRVKHASVRKQIEKSLNAAAEHHGLSRSDLEDMAVPTCGLTDVGLRQEQFGDFTAELRILSSTSTQIAWITESGKTQKTVPKRVKEAFPTELKALKAAEKLVKQTVAAQRERLEASYCANKQWTFDVWRERLVDHPLMGWIARRLVWTFGEGESSFSAVWHEQNLVDAAGQSIDLPSSDTPVRLWHPIDETEDKILAWRDWFVANQMTQPFKQAHREVYLLTDAERNTNTYSNRFAAHVLKQHQFQALCQARGWRYDLMGAWDSHNVPERLLPEHGLRAEFWVESTAEEELSPAGIFLYVATDQVRFYQYDHEAYSRDRWRSGPGEQQDLDQVPPLVFSEIMRDVDLFVGVASVANDPNWQDGGPEGRYRDYWHDTSFGDLGATAQTRREILERLVPKLKIAERCSFDEKFLIVRGDKRTYKIHLGSSNILMEPNDQYLCIVPGRGAGPGDKVFLPFEGDQRLAVILSKAMMLAADTKITDPTILSQIGR